MYRINEAASMLGVEKISIYEKLIHHGAELEAHTVKKNGITFISAEGIEILRRLIYRHEDKHLHTARTLVQSVPDEDVNVGGKIQRPQWVINKRDIDERVKMFEPALRSADSSRKQSEERTEAIDENAWTEVGGKDTEELFSQSVLNIKSMVEEKGQIKQRIAQLRNEAISLDSEIKRKDDALRSYHKLMEDDLAWLWDMEQKLLQRLAHEERDFLDKGDRESKGFLDKLLRRYPQKED